MSKTLLFLLIAILYLDRFHAPVWVWILTLMLISSIGILALIVAIQEETRAYEYFKQWKDETERT